MLRLLSLCTCLLAGGVLFAQLPNTQVYVFDFSFRDTTVRLSNPLYLTAFNERGYNNHPSWADRNTLLMSVQTPAMEQPDVYSFNVDRRSQTRLTDTKAGEFSPKAMDKGARFSAVRQEYNGSDTLLRLWEFPMNLQDDGKPVFKYTAGIGYYEWLNNIQVALYLTQSPNTLVMASADSESTRHLASQTGRCFRRQPNGNLAYVDKSRQPWKLVEKNLYRMDDPAKLITETLPGSEDFTILADGSYLMGQGSQLYRFDPARNPRWIQVADLRLYGINNITRIEASPSGRLALVNAKKR